MEKGLDKEVLEDETALTVTVDAKNGYVSVSDGGTDGAYMSGCYWNRPNGHKLLAVLVGKPTDPCIEVLCTYSTARTVGRSRCRESCRLVFRSQSSRIFLPWCCGFSSVERIPSPVYCAGNDIFLPWSAHIALGYRS